MYQQQAGAAGGMLKRHFVVIYGQLDDLKERFTRMESNLAEMALRMENLNRKYSQLEGNRSQIAESERVSREVRATVGDLKRDIDSLRARFETELLSLGDPISGKEKPIPKAETLQPAPPTLPQPETEVKEQPEQTAESLQSTESTPTDVHEPEKHEATDEPESEKVYEPSVKSLEEQLGLTSSPENSEDEQKDEQKSSSENKPEEKKKRKWL